MSFASPIVKSIVKFLCVFVGLAIYGVTNAADNFLMLYHISHKNSPDFARLGFKDSYIVYEQELIKPGSNKLENIKPEKMRLVIDNVKKRMPPGSYIQIDIESWIGRTEKGRQKARSLYLSTIQELKSGLAGYRLGYYRIVPYWAHWDINKNSGILKSWLEENAARQPIADAVDVLYPSLYTYHSDPEEWEAVAQKVIKKAREMARGKPVIPFLWPRFHPSSDIGGDGMIYLSSSYWRRQLEFVYLHADGVVIWNDGRTEPWSDDMPWWQATLSFIRQHFPNRLPNDKLQYIGSGK